MVSPCIISVADGVWYERGLDRLEKSLDDVGYSGGRLFWRGKLPDGCPTHTDAPYAFKARAFVAAQERGFSHVLWLDSMCYAIRGLDQYFELIAQEHAVFIHGDKCLGNWCIDAALPLLNITREESIEMPYVMGAAIGLDLSSENGCACVNFLLEAEISGALRGPHVRDPDSDDHPVVRGHRHDLVAWSVIANRLGVRTYHMPELFCYQTLSADERTLIYESGI